MQRQTVSTHGSIASSYRWYKVLLMAAKGRRGVIALVCRPLPGCMFAAYAMEETPPAQLIAGAHAYASGDLPGYAGCMHSVRCRIQQRCNIIRKKDSNS